MIHAILTTLGIFIGIGLVIVVVGIGFLSGAFQILGALIKQLKNQFRN